MRILFATEARVDAGSIQAIRAYVQAGREHGHEMALFGKPDASFEGVPFSERLEGFDHVVFIGESKLRWLRPLDEVRVLTQVPRERRALLDADGMYNDRIVVDDYDRTHFTDADQREWVAYYEALTDRVFQPSPRPVRPSVKSLAFYGHRQALEVARDAAPAKERDVMLVGHNWWRFRDAKRCLLPALERLKGRVRGARFIGRWWDAVPPSLVGTPVAIAFETDPAAFERAGVEVGGSVPFGNVIDAMSRARVNLMTQRPLFRHLRLLTSKFFEILCADTVPLSLIDEDHAVDVYGPEGRHLVLPDDPEAAAAKIADALDREAFYRGVVDAVRLHVRKAHGFDARVRELTSALAGETAS